MLAFGTRSLRFSNCCILHLFYQLVRPSSKQVTSFQTAVAYIRVAKNSAAFGDGTQEQVQWWDGMALAMGRVSGNRILGVVVLLAEHFLVLKGVACMWIVAVQGSDRYGLHLFIRCLLGLSAGHNRKIGSELGWHWLLEDSLVEFREGSNSTGRWVTLCFWVVWPHCFCE